MTKLSNIVTRQKADSGKIHPAVAELSQKDQAPESLPYVISFEKYKNRMCEINCLNTTKAREAINIFKNIGMNVCSQKDFSRNNIQHKQVDNLGYYAKLYKGLAPDLQLWEIKVKDTSRIFYFELEPHRTLYIVAITNTHLETGKNYR